MIRASATPHRTHGVRRSLGTLLVVCLGLWAGLACPAADLEGEGVEFFEKRIRPLLVDHCYPCHSAQAEKIKGGLSVDSRDALLHGGDLGPALVPGNPDTSLLIKAVRYTDPELQMPPKKGKLSDRQIADLTQWVKSGAPWPATDTTSPSRAPRPPQGITDEDRNWWAFRPLQRPAPPSVPGLDSGAHPIDAFIAARLQAKGLKPNPPATRRELIRRASLDLTGLPPTPEEVAAFESDASPRAWPRLVDRLLASPHYGERWARHWLDVVRFAQSNGYERDGEKQLAWRYRDYVVKAFNEDKPYDRFVLEQLAGDELETVTRDSLIATGFQRLGVIDDEPDDKRMAEFDELDDILSTTGSTFLGLSIGCARCHDHKFDPIPQTDYYRLLAFFRNLRLSEPTRFALDSANYLALTDAESVHHWQSAHDARLRLVQESLAVETEPTAKKELTQELERLKAETPPFDWALGVRERSGVPPPTHVLIRGNAGTPGVEVQPGFPEVLTCAEASKVRAPAVGNSDRASEVGRRRQFAEWVASPSNPLTARVFVNRVWQHHFGRGLAKTTSDFGKAGVAPTHPELLDWLATEFLARGWSIKALHRLVMSSETYQRSSRAEDTRAAVVDPGNDLYWRQNLRRLEAEALRDTFLKISGRLNPAMGGRGFFPRLSGEVLAGQSRPGLDWDLSSPTEQERRSLYTFVRRTMMVPILDTFDYSNTTSPLSERPITTVAPQSLLLLNDGFMHEQARALAARLVRESGKDTESRIRRGFELAVVRPPSPREMEFATAFLARQESGFASLRSRLTFRPDVPMSLSVDYMNKLRPEQFLLGPASGWSYHRGQWSAAYEGIRTVDRERAPFALWNGAPFTNAVVRARLLPHTACESAGFFIRATAENEAPRGYEFVVDPREQRGFLRRHGTQVATLAETKVRVAPGSPLDVRVEVGANRWRVWLGDASDPAIDVQDPEPLAGPGRVGFRAWGAALSVDGLEIRPDAAEAVAVVDTSLEPPAARALQAFCLLLLNLNEVVYID